ncbi:hypothetical protein H6G72_29455 [Planktothricoides sp. FACHB-1370]|uniref:Uncharacterized protein n=1 Tax=Planktothricoides raciborskii FACHB-1370 TaxID=2949576 RepID=A0ABR8EP78_9CYAN|nr:hypothetical protein [Planktothricoides raciborskii FACHB-1370]
MPKFDGIDVDQIFDFWFDRDMKSQEFSGTEAGDFAGDFSGTEAGAAGHFAGDFARA